MHGEIFNTSFQPSLTFPGIEAYRIEAYGAPPPKRAMSAFALAVIIDGDFDGHYRHSLHRLRSGQVCLFDRDEIFAPVRMHAPRLEAIGLSIDPDILERAARDMGHAGAPIWFPGFAVSSPRLEHAVKKLANAILSRAREGEHHALLAELLRELIPREVRFGVEQENGARQSILRIKKFLRDHFAEKVLLEDLESVSGLSRFHLVRRFTAEVGVPPHMYQVLLRIERAREHIRRGASPVTVASAVGFADQSHLTRHFKRRIGMTPGAYARTVALARSYA